MNILCVSAHPDDEIGCSGTLMRHIDKGDSVKAIIVTRGGYDKRHWKIMEKEILEVEKIIGLKFTILNHRMGYYHMNRETIKEITDLIRHYESEIVYTHWYNDSHQDHRAVYQNVLAACRMNHVKSLRLFEIAGYSRSETGFKPNLFIDISPYIHRKLQAVQCYESEPDIATTRFLTTVDSLAAFRGSACNTKSAEAFEVVFQCVT